MSVPFALSLSKYVNSVGTDIGFASLLGVALLALLYFAGARESRTLQDELDAAHERIAGLEARLAQTLRSQSSPGAGGPAGRSTAVPAPVTGPMGSAVARVQREAAAGAGAAAPSSAPGAALPAAAMALAGPALGSATTTLPRPVPALAPAAAPVSTPAAVPAGVPAPVAVAGGSLEEHEDDGYDEDTFGPDDTLYVPSPTTSGANARGGGPTPTPPPYAPPRFAGLPAAGAGYGADDLDDDGPDDRGYAPPPRRTIPTVTGGRERPRRRLSRLAGVLIAVGVLVVVVIVLIAATGSGKAPAPVVHHTAARHTAPRRAVRAPLSVLNGTAVAGLAATVAHELDADGFTVPKGAIANAAEQTDTSTVVGYLPGYKAEATAVAQSLSKSSGVRVAQVLPATQASITACATPTPTGAAGTCPAKVIVTVGTDLAGASNPSASGTTASGTGATSSGTG